MLRAFYDFLRLNRASAVHGRASRLKRHGHNAAARDKYAELIRRLDAIGTLPDDAARFSIRDILHLSIRIVACAEWAELLDQAGDHIRATQLAREVLDLSIRGRGTQKSPELMVKWERWARAFIGEQRAV